MAGPSPGPPLPVVIFDALRIKIRDEGMAKVADILIAVVDGLKGFPEAITAIYPEAQVQACIVHMVRHSLPSWPTPP
ncbi:hypothetical protein FAK_30380 [Desulfoferula mesophila]|uniref:Mutator family transposase n=1 Tax=Desulfoferula mesophila TaxID=3058419 RepID=A0AAU9F4G0_9BACT|nr:hypothetical protein FAK_30380 [Desulfoferula mesophilus]